MVQHYKVGGYSGQSLMWFQSYISQREASASMFFCAVLRQGPSRTEGYLFAGGMRHRRQYLPDSSVPRSLGCDLSSRGKPGTHSLFTFRCSDRPQYCLFFPGLCVHNSLHVILRHLYAVRSDITLRLADGMAE